MSVLGAHKIAGEHQRAFRILTHAAATATESRAVAYFASDAVDLTGCYFVPDEAITGDTTNRTNLNLIDAGTAGSGTTEIAHLDYATGTDGVAYDAQALATSALTTFTRYTLAAGAVVALEFEKVNTGVKIPAGLIVITYEPR